MLKKLYYRYILYFLLGIFVTHLLLSFTLAKLTSHFYDHFMINVRKFNQNEWQSLSGAYLSEKIKHAKKPVLLVLGTSFSYGLDLKGSESYSNYLNQYLPNYDILNASVKIGRAHV